MTQFENQLLKTLSSIDKSLKIMSGRNSSPQSVSDAHAERASQPRKSLGELGDELL